MIYPSMVFGYSNLFNIILWFLWWLIFLMRWWIAYIIIHKGQTISDPTCTDIDWNRRESARSCIVHELINVRRVPHDEAACSCQLFSATEFFAITKWADAFSKNEWCPIRSRISLALHVSCNYICIFLFIIRRNLQCASLVA